MDTTEAACRTRPQADGPWKKSRAQKAENAWCTNAIGARARKCPGSIGLVPARSYTGGIGTRPTPRMEGVESRSVTPTENRPRRWCCCGSRSAGDLAAIPDAEWTLRDNIRLAIPGRPRMRRRYADGAGPAVSSDRYVVDFGYVSLDRQTEHTLMLCGLPRDWMVLGLEYEVPEEARSALDAGELSDIGIYDVEVDASVTEHESGITIVSHEGQLGNQWIWSHGHPMRPAFLYSLDTMFAPTAGRTYRIRIVVSPGGNPTDARARLLVKGGGWKSNQPPADPSGERSRDLSTNEEN